jgi:hypothetical protein
MTDIAAIVARHQPITSKDYACRCGRLDCDAAVLAEALEAAWKKLWRARVLALSARGGGDG